MKLLTILILLFTITSISFRNPAQQKPTSRFDSLFALKDSCKFKNLKEFKFLGMKLNKFGMDSNFEGFAFIPEILKTDNPFLHNDEINNSAARLYSWQELDSSYISVVVVVRQFTLGRPAMLLLLYNQKGAFVTNELLATIGYTSDDGLTHSNWASFFQNDTLFNCNQKNQYSKDRKNKNITVDSVVYRKLFNHQTGKFSAGDTVYYKRFLRKAQ